jgi:NADH-quinone oxidoreductase subunit J
VTRAIFFLFAATALGSAINVLVQRHVLYSALSLIVMLGSIAGLFVLLGAEMIAAVQILVYAGAIMVLFIFVIMLLNVTSEAESRDPLWWVRLVGIPAGLFLLSMLSAAIWQPGAANVPTAVVRGTPREIGSSLFTTFVLPFEATSILILIAIVGALVLAKRQL